MRAEPVICERWADGQAGSLRCGIEELTPTRTSQGDRDARRPAPYDFRSWSRGSWTSRRPPARSTTAVRVIRSCSARMQMRLIGNLHGDRGARGLLHGGTTIECGHLPSARDVDTPKTWRRSAMKLEQSFEVAAPLERVWRDADRRRARCPVPAGRRGHRPQRGRQLQRDVHGQDRADHGLVHRQARDGANRRGVAHRDDAGPGHRQARPGWREGDDPVEARAGRRVGHPRRGRDRLPHHRARSPVSDAAG